MKSTIITIMCIINTVFSKHHHHHHHHHHKSHHNEDLEDILNSKENFFIKTNVGIQNIMNKIFEELDIPNHFVEEWKIKLLLTMHYDLNNIAEKNFEVYDILKNATAITVDNKAVNKIRLDDIVRETLSEVLFYDRDGVKDNKKNHSIQITHTTNKPLTGFNDSREFKDFIKGFLIKVNSLTVDDLFKKKGSPKLFEGGRRNLKLWQPSRDIGRDWTTNGTDSRRIYQGKKTNIQNFPFVASVHVLDEFLCAGNVISKDLILTAASCVQIHYNNRYFRENPKTTYVRIGSDWISRRGEQVPVLEIFFYPSYDPKTLKHNLALLRLERIIKFQSRGRSKVRRIALDRGTGHLASNTQEIIILGWGAKQANQIINNYEKLSVAYLDIYPIRECKNIYSNDYITDSNFCAGFMSRGGGACNRDVGAPGIVEGVLVGVVSFGAPVCGALDSPTVYTRVGPYINWIETIMETNPPRYGKPRTTKMGTRPLIFYFSTLSTRSFPHMTPITKGRTKALARTQEETIQEDILHAILADIGRRQNDSLIKDIIDKDLTGDFYDICDNSTEDDNDINIIVHPLVNKSLFPIPGVHYEMTTPNYTTPTPITFIPTYVFDTTTVNESVSTEPSMTRKLHFKYELDPFDQSDNYESASNYRKNPTSEYDSADTQDSRQEDGQKRKRKSRTVIEPTTENTNYNKIVSYRTTMMTDRVDLGAQADTGEDYSPNVDVAFE